MSRSLFLFALTAAACSQASSTPPPTPSPTPTPCELDPRSLACKGDPPPYTGDNPIDAVMNTVFFQYDFTPTEAETAELCRRLYVDLIGRSPTSEEVTRECAGKSVDAIARALQARPEYLLVSERSWRDRLDVDDVRVGWRYTKDLFALVDQLHQGRLGYGDFAVAVLAHPGFTMTKLQPDDRVRAAFLAFLGRAATKAEAEDLASLVRPWIPRQINDPDFPYLTTNEALIFPILCQPLLRCSASLLGGGHLDLTATNAEPIRYDDLNAQQRMALRELGRVFVRQPFFYEAEADEILNRLLGWSDGGRFPREPGIVLPEVRQALAEALAKDGSVPAAERIVLSSWLYRQAAAGLSDGQGDDPAAPIPEPWTSGPLKAMSAEAWLDSLSNLSISFGTCDPRYSDTFSFFQMIQAVQTGTITTAQFNADAVRLHDLMGLRMPIRHDDTLNLDVPDFRYLQVARLIGGCPGFQARRTGPTGIAFAFTQEALAEILCAPTIAFRASPPGADQSVAALVRHQIPLLFGRAADPEEATILSEHQQRCSGADCQPGADPASVCTALAGSAEGLFY